MADPFAWDLRPERPDKKDRRALFAREHFHFTNDSLSIRETALGVMLRHPVRAHVFYSHMEWASGLSQADIQTAMYFTLVRTLLQRYAGTHLELVFENESTMDALYGKLVQHAIDTLDRETKRKPRQPRATVEARIAHKPNGGLSTVDYCLEVANLGLQARYGDGKEATLKPNETEAVARLDQHISHVANFDDATHQRRFDILRTPSWARHIAGANSHSEVFKSFTNLIASGPTGPFTYVDSLGALATALGISAQALNRARELAAEPTSYRFPTATIRGKRRRFTVPTDELLISVQRRLLDLLRPLNDALHPSCVAYVPSRQPVDAASPHSGSAWIQKLDIADFFPSTSSSRICSTFEQLGASPEVASALADLTTHNHVLPTGARNSPFLSNLVLADFDYTIAAEATSIGVTYSRYADDLVFSAAEEFDMVPVVSRELDGLGYRLNPRKMFLRRRGQPVRVAGLTVFEADAPRLPKRTKRRLRIELFLLEKGLDSARHVELDEDEKSELAARAAATRGLVRYCQSVEPHWTSRLVSHYPTAQGIIELKADPAQREKAVGSVIKRINATVAPRLTISGQALGGPQPLDHR